MRFKDKVVFITGAASGIGREAARQFAREGGRMAISDRNAQDLEETKNLLATSGAEVQSYHLDVSEYEQVKSVIHAVHKDFGRLDVSLNNAGIGARNNFRTAEHTLEDWDHVIAVNQSGVFYCMKEELGIMKEQSSGAIINISSIAGIKALPRQMAYVASKAAVIGMTKTAALEYARFGIRVNAICPVFTISPMTDTMFAAKEGLREKLLQSIPLGRFGEVTDMVHTILWLADEQSSFITGLSIPVDGGLTA